MNEEQVQPVAVVNYPNEHLYTRVTEFKHLTGQEHRKTQRWSTSTRRPRAIRTTRCRGRRTPSSTRSTRSWPTARPDVHFVGRLATYKYYNMDQVVAQALSVYARIVGQKRAEATRTALAPAVSLHLAAAERCVVAEALAPAPPLRERMGA